MAYYAFAKVRIGHNYNIAIDRRCLNHTQKDHDFFREEYLAVVDTFGMHG